MRRGFSLTELLVVVSLVAIALSMVFVMNNRRRDSLQVRAAADELAGVMRKTRDQAIEQKAFFAIAFNITNGKGTSGRVLNNHDGGHWYRVLGPSANNYATQGYNVLPYMRRDSAPGGRIDDFSKRDYPVRAFLAVIANSWESGRHVLPSRSVRFLALGDQDNGSHCRSSDAFQPTYPRPWFGTWDAGSGKWYAWGGYNPELPDSSPFWGTRTGLDGSQTSASGFYYEGAEGRVEGCVNPRDRLIWDDTDHNGFIDLSPNSDGAPSWPLLRLGEQRPLVNADWLDALLVFYPDGRVGFDWFDVRRTFADRAWENNPQTFKSHGAHQLAMGDMSNVFIYPWQREWNVADEVSHYAERSGFYYITLGRDAADDRDTFSSPDALIDSLMPAVRVGINRFGEVRVVPVRRSLRPSDGELDPVAQGTWWNKSSPPIGQDGYQGNLRGAAQLPVSDALTPAMVANRQWWFK